MATLDKAEQLEERLVMSTAQQGVQGTMRLSTEASKRMARWSGAATKKMASGMLGTATYGAQALSGSLREMADGIRDRAHEQKWGSEVPLEDFAEAVDGRREVVDLEDNELVDEVRQELRKHNVTFAVEQDDQDRFYLHVSGNDANLITHALDRAQERLDALRTRDEPTQERGEETPDRDAPTPGQEPEQDAPAPGARAQDGPTQKRPETPSPEDARQRGPEPAPSGRDPRTQERPTVGRDDARRQPERAEGRSRGDAPRRTGLDSREQSKATVRDKISAVADRLQSAAGRDAPTHVRGLDAHKKGPTR